MADNTDKGWEPSPDIEQAAYEMFAGAYPHEAHADDPDRFWAYHRRRCPGVSRKTMEATLQETA